jgi:hypothetical protein
MAVRSSVIEDDEGREEDVAVAFCTPEIMVPGITLPNRIGMFVDNRLLGWREVESTEESCADRHCAKRTRGIENEDIEGIIEAEVKMYNERQAR